MKVGRENIEISVLDQPDEGLLGLGLSQEEIASGVYLIVGLLFVGLLYRAGKPTIVQIVKRQGKRWLQYRKRWRQHMVRVSINQAILANMAPVRTAKLGWFVLMPVTLGIYTLVVNYRIANELKEKANIGPGGLKHVIFMIIPLYNLYRGFQFVGEVRQLEVETGHSANSTSSPLTWFILGLHTVPNTKHSVAIHFNICAHSDASLPGIRRNDFRLCNIWNTLVFRQPSVLQNMEDDYRFTKHIMGIKVQQLGCKKS